MVLIKSLASIAATVLLLQQSVDAVPVRGPKALLKRGSTLNGKFLHITGNYTNFLYRLLYGHCNDVLML